MSGIKIGKVSGGGKRHGRTAGNRRSGTGVCHVRRRNCLAMIRCPAESCIWADVGGRDVGDFQMLQ